MEELKRQMEEMKLRAQEETKGNTNVFEPERKKWVIIRNRNYEELRKMPGFAKF